MAFCLPTRSCGLWIEKIPRTGGRARPRMGMPWSKQVIGPSTPGRRLASSLRMPHRSIISERNTGRCIVTPPRFRNFTAICAKISVKRRSPCVETWRVCPSREALWIAESRGIGTRELPSVKMMKAVENAQIFCSRSARRASKEAGFSAECRSNPGLARATRPVPAFQHSAW
jgi:hypothetical protein